MAKRQVATWINRGGMSFYSNPPSSPTEMEVDEDGIPTQEEIDKLEQDLWESSADEWEEYESHGGIFKCGYVIEDLEGNTLEECHDIPRDDLFHEEVAE